MKSRALLRLLSAAAALAGCAGPQYHPVRGLPKSPVTIKAITFEREIANHDWKSLIDVEADRAGEIYILDASTHQVAVCDALGNSLHTIGETGFWSKTFPRPSGIAVDSRGRVFVADTKRDNIQVFDSSGALLFSIGKKGSSQGRFRDPRGLDVGEKGNIYVVDEQNSRVQAFDPDGRFLLEIVSGPKDVRDINISRARGPVKFIAWPEFNRLADVAVGSNRRLYILDAGNCMVHVYSLEGAYLFSFGGRGRRTGSFKEPRGIAVAEAGVVCVSDEAKANVQLFDPDGRFLACVGGEGDTLGRFEEPQGVGASGSRVYVADRGNRRIQVFSYSVPLPESAAVLEKPVRIAIFDFKNNNPAAQARGYGQSISEMFVTAFARSPSFEVLERKQLRKVLDELYFDQSGVVEAETAKKIGKILGIDVALAGGVSAFATSIEIDLRMIDVETGRVIMADSIMAASEGQLRSLVNREAGKLVRDYAIRFGPPAAPRELRVMGGVKSCTLLWSQNKEPDLKEYRIYRSGSPEGTYDLVASTPETEWMDTGLSDGARFYYRLSAVDNDGMESPECRPVECVTRKRPSSGRLRVKPKTQVKKISFSWNENDEGVTEYVIYRAPSPEGPFEEVGTTRATRFSEGGFRDGETYYYRVVKKYRSGLESEPSKPFSVSTEAPPGEPKGVTARSGLARRVVVSWKKPGEKDIREHRIYRATEADGDYERIAGVAYHWWSYCRYTDTGLDDDTTYYYRVQAVDVHDLAGPMSAPIKATTKRAPSRPTLLRAESRLARRVPITWHKNPEKDIVKYVVFMAESEDGPFSELGHTKTNRFVHMKCADDTRYCYKVRAVDRDGLVSDFSEIVSAVTKPRPTAPRGLKAESGLVKSARLEWQRNPETDIDHYLVHRRLGNHAEFRNVGKSRSPHYLDTGLQDGSIYEYIIKAVDRDGLVSDASESVEIKTKPRPAPPQGVKAEARIDRIALSWSPNPEPDIAGYEIYRKKEWDLLHGEVKIGQVDGLAFEDYTAQPGNAYRYTVIAFDRDGLRSSPSKEVSASLPQPGGESAAPRRVLKKLLEPITK